MSKKKKIRTDFRKHHESRVRRGDLTRKYHRDDETGDEEVPSERISGKGELTRKRTVMAEDAAAADDTGLVPLAVEQADLLHGRVLSVFGLTCLVEADDGRTFHCAIRRLLKTLSTELRHVVAAGDLVHFRPAAEGEGLIERVERRTSVLERTSKGRQHVLVANMQQLVIVASVAEPTLKPNLIDRFLIAAEKANLEPIICLNKVDLVDPADLQPIAGVFGQMGYEVLLTSAATGAGVDRLRARMSGRESAVCGQSGVGKSSLLNAVEPGLGLKVAAVSAENQKGRHTTTTARLIRLSSGGHVIDTPGIRQFQLWDVIPAEVAGYFRDLRPLVSLCRFPNCTHTHEADCAVKDAVADGKLDARRYESYCQLFAGDDE